MTFESGRQDAGPIFNAPAVVVVAIAVMVLIHACRMALDTDLDSWIVLAFAYIPARYAGMDEALPGAPWSAFVSPFTHMLLHADWMHLGLNSAWMLAFGSIIARRMNVLRFIALSVICGVAGVGLFEIMNTGELKPIVGASGAVSGLMGAVFRFLFHMRDYGGFPGLSPHRHKVPLMTLGQALSDRRVLLGIGVWFGVNALFATDVGHLLAEGEIAWEAHIGGFLAGFLLIGLFDGPVRDTGPEFEEEGHVPK